MVLTFCEDADFGDMASARSDYIIEMLFRGGSRVWEASRGHA